MNNLAVFSGSANPQLTKDICFYIGKKITNAEISHFADGETLVKINEDVRGKDCFIVQPTSPPVNDNIMELLVFIDCLKRAEARSITPVIPYYGYARQDRKAEGRTPITAKMVADLIGITASRDLFRVVAMDLHSKQVEGFFDVPVNNLKALPVFVNHLKMGVINPHSYVILSPDVGSAKRAKEYADELGLEIAIIDKKRINDEETEVMNIVGNVEGKRVLMFDDMIATAGTICAAAKAAEKKGAGQIHVYATHGLFTGNAINKLQDSGITTVTVSDTVVLNKAIRDKNEENYGGEPHKTGWPVIRVVSIAKLLGEAILRIYERRSVSTLLKCNHEKGIRYL